MSGNRFSADDMERCGFLNTVVGDNTVEDRALRFLHDTMKAWREVIATQKRLHRTWKNSFEREAIAGSQHRQSEGVRPHLRSEERRTIACVIAVVMTLTALTFPTQGLPTEAAVG